MACLSSTSENDFVSTSYGFKHTSICSTQVNKLKKQTFGGSE